MRTKTQVTYETTIANDGSHGYRIHWGENIIDPSIPREGSGFLHEPAAISVTEMVIKQTGNTPVQSDGWK